MATFVATLRHWFLPHLTNNFRAKALHHDVFLVYIGIFLWLQFIFRFVHQTNPDILGYATNIYVEQLLQNTNQKRAELGLSQLQLNDQLSQAAAAKATHMFSNNYWAHTSPNGTTPWDFINQSGYLYTLAGENLAKNFSDSSGVVEAWMNSPTHRENIEKSEYRDIGFGVVNGVLNGEETTLVVQMFGKSLGSQNIAQKTSPPEERLAIPVQAAEATEINVSPTSVITQVVPSPSAQVLPVNKEVVISKFANSVVKNPLFDINILSRNIGLTTMIALLGVIVIDGVYVWKKGILRTTGRNIAHILFLLAVSGMMVIMKAGSVI